MAVSPLQIHAWLQYSDLSLRLNTLLDEYTHLQSTLYGLLPATLTEAQLFESGTGTERGSEGETADRKLQLRTSRREILDADGITCRSYSSAHRTFLAYIEWLGELVAGLQENKKTCEVAYNRFVIAQRDNPASNSSELYFWFAALRGHYVDKVFEFYTDQLEHAHEKLVQVLENFPGGLPQPILLRRWNSASYEEFLSGYFTHTKWLVRRLVGEMLGFASDEANPGGTFTHSWTHVPTSRVVRFRVRKPIMGDGQQGRDGGEIGSVRSAFFYLEQPALFPLLLHESAHFYFPDEAELDQLRKRVDSYKGPIPTTFFLDRKNAAEALRQAWPFELDNKDWLDAFTVEVWIDTISVKLGGVPYLSALFSQLFGVSQPAHFSHVSRSDGKWIVGAFGTNESRCIEVHIPEAHDGYLWEARLSIAVKVCKLLGVERASEAEKAWLESCETMLRAWWVGGGSANEAATTSEEHAVYWKYREQINGWVTDVIWSYLEPSMDTLRRYPHTWNYHFGPYCPKGGGADRSSPVPAIVAAVNNYLASSLGVSVSAEEDLRDLAKLDACPLAVRWTVGNAVVAKMLGAERLGDWSTSFLDYVRHDGHTAFRVAMEWYLARESAFSAIGDVLRHIVLPERITAVAQRIAGGSATDRFLAEVYSIAEKLSIHGREAVLTLIEKRKYDNDYAGPNFSADGLETYDCENAKQLVALVECQGKAVNDRVVAALGQGREIPVGTLTFGLLRPAEIVQVGTELPGRSPYLHALRKADEFFEAERELLTERRHRIGGGMRTELACEFLALAGDYSFLHYLEGITPVERDVHPRGLPKMLTKPRTVLKLANRRPDRQRSVGLVTMLRQMYRYEWIQLQNDIESADNEVPYTLYLSSGWEDVIVISWHKTMRALQSFRRKAGLVRSGFGSHDTQSAICMSLDQLPLDSSAVWQWPSDGFANDSAPARWESIVRRGIGNGGTGIERMYEMMGRYDYSIRWSDGQTGMSAECAVFDYLCRLPVDFWRPITNYSTAVLTTVGTPDEPVLQDRSMFVTRLVLD